MFLIACSAFLTSRLNCSLRLALLRIVDRVELAEQLGGLIEQRNIGDRERRIPVAAQQVALGLRPVRREAGEPVRPRVEILDELLGRERQPGRVERDAHVVGAADVLAQPAEVGVVDRAAVGAQLGRELAW